jgi:hypothetical protein
MAYLHCHNCGWGQDDFWEKDGYNPFSSSLIKYLEETLFQEHIVIDRNYVQDMAEAGYAVPFEMTDRGCKVKATDFVATELRRKANSIQNMHVKTWEEWQEVKPIAKCPRCDKRDWDID